MYVKDSIIISSYGSNPSPGVPLWPGEGTRVHDLVELGASKTATSNGFRVGMGTNVSIRKCKQEMNLNELCISL